MVENVYVLPDNLPVPEDDGACRHLPGIELPSVPLLATTGEMIDVASLPGLTVLYCFPRTGRPGVPNPEGWDLIPGARGCTPQACSFRDHFQELQQFDARVFGFSTQTPEVQQELVERLHLPFSLLSDEHLTFVQALRLPTFTVEGMTLVKRLTLIVESGKIIKVFYPIFPPDKHVNEVLAWLAQR
ncbi:peroxiredoxin [Thermosporothrix hazakensis]|jgi:peroxiredoxin|uniref:Peroxiredoxin n=1 Tax=Thermosporothrix hazakensis TaxID=644383 RepID=A0A326U4G6_THEHA|nr:peroxiredoxin [Thermosporothrix hazakensis]PZW27912.1 peroxiredoxin [Thermosporothrix hazakensis]GCE51137.1 peroxiredoxin [Thermosporothrix hazakensis]